MVAAVPSATLGNIRPAPVHTPTPHDIRAPPNEFGARGLRLVVPLQGRCLHYLSTQTTCPRRPTLCEVMGGRPAAGPNARFSRINELCAEAPLSRAFLWLGRGAGGAAARLSSRGAID